MSNKQDSFQEPTIEWLIDELVPNRGNSPLVNFNKKRLRDLIAASNTQARIDELEQARNASLDDEMGSHYRSRKIELATNTNQGKEGV